MSSYFVRTFKRRKAFLDCLAAGDTWSKAAREAGGTPREFKAWQRDDVNFAADIEEAIEEGDDFVEDVALERALKKSDTLMLAFLKARKPEKFDRASKMELSGSIDVSGAKAKLLNKIARLQAAGAISAPPSESEQTLPEPEREEERPKILALPAPALRTPFVRGRKRQATTGRG